jgi:phosphoribosyl-AMP cyclohydrolase
MTHEPPYILSQEAAKHLIDQLAFDKAELLPAIAIQHATGEVLMQAWMNRDALLHTLTQGRACYYSRSRQGLWVKGDTSGHIQHMRGIRIDCDYDSIILLVHQEGPACHTNRRSCYFFAPDTEGNLVSTMPPIK